MRSRRYVGDCDDEPLDCSRAHVRDLRFDGIYNSSGVVRSKRMKACPNSSNSGRGCSKRLLQVLIRAAGGRSVELPKVVVSARSEEPVEGVRV
jgi:hypothetical protein